MQYDKEEILSQLLLDISPVLIMCMFLFIKANQLSITYTVNYSWLPAGSYMIFLAIVICIQVNTAMH